MIKTGEYESKRDQTRKELFNAEKNLELAKNTLARREKELETLRKTKGSETGRNNTRSVSEI